MPLSLNDAVERCISAEQCLGINSKDVFYVNTNNFNSNKLNKNRNNSNSFNNSSNFNNNHSQENK